MSRPALLSRSVARAAPRGAPRGHGGPGGRVDPKHLAGAGGLRRALRFARKGPAFALVLALAACAAAPEVRRNALTGIETRASGLRILDRSSEAHMGARVLVQRRGAETHYSIYTIVQRFDGNFPDIRAARTEAGPSGYLRLDRQYANCAVRCVREETGMIPLRPVEMRAAAGDGMRLRLAGPRGAHEGLLPAAAFREALGGG